MKKYIKKLTRNERLSSKETEDAFKLILGDTATPAQIGAFLGLLCAKGESANEILGAATFVKTKMIPVSGLEGALDIVGTGGDSHDTINVSTLAAFVCASLGVPIAKHGTRALSSKCGSFDVLEELGVILPSKPNEAKKLFKKTNAVFLFAPHFHPAFKKVHPIRRELGIRTIFNLVGPLLNPANTAYQVVGVSKVGLAKQIGAALIAFGRKRVLVVHSRDGLDEVSVSAITDVYDFAKGRKARHFTIKPAKKYPLRAVKGGTPKENAVRFQKILSGKGSPAENEFVSLNAALGLLAVGKAKTFKEGKQMALTELLSGNALKVLEKVTAK